MNRRSIQKRAPRVDLRRSGKIIDSDGRISPVIILDVSSGGFRLEISESLFVGEFVTLHADHEEAMQAQIRWVLGSEAGGVFVSEGESKTLRP